MKIPGGAVWVAWFMAAVAGGGCVAQRTTPSAQCVLNGDCAAGLFCLSGACRLPCTTDRDCLSASNPTSAALRCMADPATNTTACVLAPDAGADAAGPDATNPDAISSDVASADVLSPDVAEASASGYGFVVGAAPRDISVGADGGGMTPYSLVCPNPNEVVIGATLGDDEVSHPGMSYIRSAQLDCGALSASGTASAVMDRSTVADTACTENDARSSTNADCPVGMLAVGIYGSTDLIGGQRLVTQLGLTCASLPEWITRGSVMANTMQLTARGTAYGEGTAFDLRCPSGFVLGGLVGMTGCNFDQLSVRCLQVHGP